MQTNFLKIGLFALIVSACTITSCEEDDIWPAPQTLTFDFDKGYQDWTVGFSDYSDDQEGLDLKHEIAPLPAPLSGSGKKGLLVSSHNRPDDIFMFITRKVKGLKPSSIYRLSMDIQLASDAPSNAIGIGGAPGEAVFVKAGGSHIRPEVKKNANGRYEFNLNKGNQGQEGAFMKIIGNVANGKDEFVYTSIQRKLSGYNVLTDMNGECWLLIGTDSGYEGVTALYYQHVKAVFELAD